MSQASQTSTVNNEMIVSQPSQQAQPSFLSTFQYLPQYNTVPYQYIGHKLMTTILSVSISQLLVNRTIVYKYMKDALFKNIKDQTTRKQSLTMHLKKLTKKMIQYNSIVFSTKVILDQHYSQTMQKNNQYYQSNQLIHYKIGAISGLTAYLLNLPLAEWQLIRSSVYHYDGKAMSKMYGWKGLKSDVKEFFKIDTIKSIVNKFSMTSLVGVIIYRTIYFGGYEKIKSRNQHPINEYLIAPVLSSLLGLIISPLDYIKFLQLTSHKDKSFLQIINEKGIKIWNIPHQRVSVSVIRQASCMSFFMLGQKFCKKLINYSHTNY